MTGSAVNSEFPDAEYQGRVERARELMEAAGIDCLLLSWDRNLRYFSGFYTQGWINPTRPRYLLLPLEGDPIAVLPSTQVVGFRRMSWIQDVRTWPDPRPADSGFTLVVEALRAIVGSRGRVGAEIGSEARMGAPVGDFIRMRETLEGWRFVDAAPVLTPLRMVKSAAEIEQIKRMAQVTGRAFDKLQSSLLAGQTERIVYHATQRFLAEECADEIPYIVPISGPSGYEHSNTGPTDRQLRSGDILFVDICASQRGYFADFNRNYAFGAPAEEIAGAYARAFDAAEAGIGAVRPGVMAADIFGVMAKIAYSHGTSAVAHSALRHGVRMGHGVGMDSAEPPSLMQGDETVLQEGMVLAIEPILLLPGSAHMAKRLMIHEENVVVTRTGVDLLSPRTPKAIPLV